MENATGLDEVVGAEDADLADEPSTSAEPTDAGEAPKPKEPVRRSDVMPTVAGTYAKAPRRRWRRRVRAVRMGIVHMLVVGVVALVLGVVVGLFAYPLLPLPGTQASLPGRTTVTGEELGTPLGSYAYDGEVTQVTVREAIEETSSLEAAKNEDGTYDIPSADAVLSVARNHFLLLEAESRGIVASDEEVAAYVQTTWGTTDYAALAASYHMSEEQVKEFMKRAATLRKLRDEVVTTSALSEPQPPAEPEEGMERYATQEYAEYVLGLVGDEWDANANWWARDDGPFRDQLINFSLSNEAATYAAAQAAYFVARSQYAAVEQQIAEEWSVYVNQILSEVTVELGTLVA
ncbi:MAG: hypothetical protein J6S63_05135 [Atopobiaceae bacterium]|nr:hypothetical protein [Atopobiaceae bacterium]